MKLYLSLCCLAAPFIPNSVLAQQYCQLGSERWVAGCEQSCTAAWEGSDCPKSCIATAPPGHVIINHRVIQHSVNNGGGGASRVAAGQQFDYSRQVRQAYSNAIEMAAKANEKSAEARLRQEMNQAMSEAESLSSSHQAVRLDVSANPHGNQLFDRKRGWSSMSVELLVKCITPSNLQQQLMERYALQ